MPVGELLQRMSSRELAEWEAFFALEAEDRRTDRLATSAAAIVQGLRTRRRGRR